MVDGLVAFFVRGFFNGVIINDGLLYEPFDGVQWYWAHGMT